MKKEIEGATAVLVGKALWKWDRASNMATFEFGRKSQVIGTPGNVREVGEWALDVQCAWRITRQDQVVVGSRDVYYPAEYDESKSIPSGFEWERDPNRRDKLLSVLFEANTKQFIVQKIEVGAAGDLRIALDEGLSLDLFVDDSLSDERWRLFQRGKSGHFVVKGSDASPSHDPETH